MREVFSGIARKRDCIYSHWNLKEMTVESFSSPCHVGSDYSGSNSEKPQTCPNLVRSLCHYLQHHLAPWILYYKFWISLLFKIVENELEKNQDYRKWLLVLHDFLALWVNKGLVLVFLCPFKWYSPSSLGRKMYALAVVNWEDIFHTWWRNLLIL